MDISEILELDQFYYMLSCLVVICKWIKVSKSGIKSKTKQMGISNKKNPFAVT